MHNLGLRQNKKHLEQVLFLILGWPVFLVKSIQRIIEGEKIKCMRPNFGVVLSVSVVAIVRDGMLWQSVD